MALSEAQRKANDKYIAAHYERLPISYSREFCADVRAAAQAKGQTLAGYVRAALVAYMAAPARDQAEREGAAPSQPAPDEPPAAETAGRASNVPPAPVLVEPIKRKPGRPRKVQAEPGQDDAPPVKRKRGRPRKTAPTE